MKSVKLENVRFTDGYWKQRTDVNESITLNTEYEQLKMTGRLDTFKQQWCEGMKNKPHAFWDSDVAKWIEACSYSLLKKRDDELISKIEDVIDDMEKAQWEDGYLNSYFSVIDPTARWTSILRMHELYCAGHLIEAAVAYHKATGRDRFLKIMCRYADHIDSVFGKEKGKLHAYPGHEEIELALVKLYEVTNNEKYLKLATYFINERGQEPLYFAKEEKALPANKLYYHKGVNKRYSYVQAHKPLKKQETILGHSVRALYLLAGAADVADKTGDIELLKACERLYENMTQRRMYITGGIGDTHDIERFSFDYNLPNETAYAETCAAIASIFFCSRMLNITGNSRYGDTMEKTLYNGMMSGVSLDGKKFFYSNPLAVEEEAVLEETLEFKSQMGYQRREWFGCACCPPNLARLLASLGKYFYSQSCDGLFVNLYGSCKIDLDKYSLEQITNYPWDEVVLIRFNSESPVDTTINLRIPGWCKKYSLKINGDTPEYLVSNGYAQIKRIWNDGDEIELIMDMPVVKMQVHPHVRHNVGKLALVRGPIVYCLEEMDNGKNLSVISIKADDQFKSIYDPDFLGGCTYIEGPAYRLSLSGFEENLYKPYSPEYQNTSIKAIPYSLWTNRKPGSMIVWINAVQ